jgi:membrane protein DedA with SNARE-associated domain
MRWGSRSGLASLGVAASLALPAAEARAQGRPEPTYGRLQGDVTLVAGLGGVVAARGHINIVALIVLVVACGIGGDSVGYLVGQKWGHRLLQIRFLQKRQRALDLVLDQLNRRGAIAVFLARFTAFLRAVVPGLAGLSSMPYRIFLPANAAGGLVWGTAFCLLGYLVGNAYAKVEHLSGIASDVLLGLIAVALVALLLRHRLQGHRLQGRRLKERARPSPRAPNDPPP